MADVIGEKLQLGAVLLLDSGADVAVDWLACLGLSSIASTNPATQGARPPIVKHGSIGSRT
jgi:hypothetical protein